MAVDPKLIINISTNVAQVQQNLKQFGQTIEVTQKDLQRLSSSFSGDKLIKDAHAITAAVHDMGGATKLTEAEKRKLNRTLTEALEKYKALGKDAPAAMRELATATQQNDKPTQSWSDKLLTVQNAMKGFIALQAVSFIKDQAMAVIDYAGNLTDLAAKTGISTTGLQKLELAFQGSGISIDTVTAATSKLASNLIGGNAGAVAALEKMGLSVEDLKKMAPEKQFLTVADAVGKIQNPTERTYAAMQTFGKGGAELLAGLTGNLTETTERFEAMGLVMSEDTIAAADEFGDQLGLMGKQLTAIVASIVGPLLPALTKLGNALLWIGQKVLGPVLNVAIKATITLLDGMWMALSDILGNILSLGEKIPGIGPKFADAAQWLKESSASAAERIEKLWTETDSVAKSTTAAAAPMLGLGDAAERAAAKGKKAAEEFAKLAKEAAGFNPGSFDWQLALDQFGRGKGQLETRLLTSNLGRGPSTLPASMVNAPPTITSRTFTSFGLGPAPIGPKTFDSSRGSLFSGLSQSLPTTMLDALAGGGSVTKTAAATAGSSIATNVVTKFGSTIESTLGKTFGGAINAVLPGLGTLAAPLMDFVGKLFGKSEESAKVSPVRDEFFKLQGGLETLNPKVQQVTGSLKLVDDVFKAKTVDQYNAAVAAVTNTLAEFQGKLDTASAAQLALADRMAHVTTISPEVQAALQAAYDSTNPDDYLAAISSINGLLDDQASQQNFLEDTMKKYGLAWTELGQEARNAKVAEIAKDIAKEFDVLRGSGINVNHIMEKMGPNINDFIKEARVSKTEVPESFRRIIQTAIDAGQVFDDNKQKITDMKNTGLTFGTSMETVQLEIRDAMVELARVLRDTLGGAFTDVSATAQREFRNIPSRIPIEVDYYSEGANLPGNDYDIPGFAGGTRGRYLDFGSGTLAMLHGRERVMTEGEGASGGGDVTVVINANNSFFDSPSALQRLADKVSEAVSRDVRLRTRYQTV